MKITDKFQIIKGNFTATIAGIFTANRNLTLPDKDGTIALIVDIVPPRLNRLRGGIFDHFIGSFSPTVASSVFEITTQLTGTGATVGTLTGEANNPGILRIQTGTTTTGAVLLKTPDCIQLGGSMSYSLKCCVRIPTLPTAADNFTIALGFSDRPNSVSGTSDGCFYVIDTINSQWSIVTRKNNVATRIDTVVGISANIWYDLEIRVNSDASSASFYADNQLLGTLTTNIPNSGGSATAVGFLLLKTAGTNSRFLDIDYLSLEWGY